MAKKKGFTLVELIVVIAIIGLMAGFSFVSYEGIQKSGRDGQRKSDLEQIRSALEMCYADDNEYPASLASGSPLTCVSTKVYLNPVPTDPINDSGTGYIYSFSLTSTAYTLCAKLETDPSNPHCVSNP